ncbi:glutamate-1-semialdehyde 2,1-aminomutase [Flavobacteriales bacterium]|jgi:glutamate-1-semialdehyde 2,1-aminomutase|nr:glutamate-1-semialdehyde 2,1-aminomutase [Flavobacteriales bacterium]
MNSKTHSIQRVQSKDLFERSKVLFPGGVNSPVRAFGSVGGTPLFMEKGQGAYIWDADGNRFIDFCCSWGPLILGHAHPRVEERIIEAVRNGTTFGTPTRLENELGSLIVDHHPYVEQIRFVSSGTEAAMSAIRLARGVTGRSKIIKFDGCYHGHVDSLLVKAGSGLATLGTSSSAGVPESYAQETLVLPLNDLEALEQCVLEYKDEIAVIAIEPIPANNGLLIQDESFLHGLRSICDREGILLLFDEVISGFRVAFDGAAGYYGIRPDVLAFGKIIGGGMPVGAYASSAEVMAHIAPSGPVYQAGTLSGNPVAMAAGAAQLTELLRPGFYEDQERRTKRLITGILKHSETAGYPLQIFNRGSIFWLAFSDRVWIRKSSEIDPDSMAYFSKLHSALLNRGIYLGPSGYEVGFVSAAHSDAIIDEAIHAFCSALDEVFESR